MLHTLYIATCYIPYLLLLLLGITILPALALFPGLIRTPLLASVVPIISILIVNVIALILFALQMYTHLAVCMITVILSIIGFFRGRHYYRTQSLDWPSNTIYLLLINITILFPMLAFNGISTFMGDDALVSWNYWAMHFYTGVFPDDTAGYPPFYPVFLSYCYKLLGNPEYQGPVKALLCIFPFTIMNNIAFISKRSLEILPAYLLIILNCVFPGFLTIGFYKFYTTGYADPMLAAAISASVALFLKYLDEQKPEYLWYAVLCGITASLVKQPAFLWALFSMPVIIIWCSYQQKKLTNYHAIMLFILVIPAVSWLLGKGGHFYNNSGVITASLHSSQITLNAMGSTLLKSIYQYFVTQPSLLLIYVLAAIAAFKQKKLDVYVVFIVPATLLWFIFGSYHIRLGLHIIVSCALLIANYDYFISDIQSRFPNYQHFNSYIFCHIKKITYTMLVLSFILFIIFSIREQKNKHQNMPGHIYPLNAGLTNIGKYFDKGADYIYQNIYNNPAIKIWAPTRYITGIFYGHTSLVLASEDNSAAGIYKDIQQYKPDYIFAPGRILSEVSNNIQQLVQQCPRLFVEIPLGNPLYGYRVYKVDINYLNTKANKDCRIV